MPQRRDGQAAEATAAPAGRKTLEAVSGAERIADALALVAAEAERVQVKPLPFLMVHGMYQAPISIWQMLSGTPEAFLDMGEGLAAVLGKASISMFAYCSKA